MQNCSSSAVHPIDDRGTYTYPRGVTWGVPVQNLAQALAGFHADVGRILKQSDAQYGKYADLATVLATVSPSLSQHGLVLTQTFMPFDGTTLLRTTLLHSSGESVCSDLPMPSTDGARNALHAFGAAVTYLRRYALLAILNLAAEDDDGQSFGQEPKAVAASGTGTKRQTKKAVTGGNPVPGAARLDADEKKSLLTKVQSLGPDHIPQLATAFRERFSLPPDVAVSDYIKTRAHAEFINDWIAAATAPVPA